MQIIKNNAVYPGSFDPVTNGHLDIIKRASSLVCEVIVCVFNNPNKNGGMFSIDDRVTMLKQATKDIPNVRVVSYSGLLENFCREKNINLVIRGLRTCADFEYETQRALFLKNNKNDLETVFIVSNPKYNHISSSGVREILAFNGNISPFVPVSVTNLVNKE